ncbi:MAG: metalloregulator ArsR/SmtB family transcription factor [Planctomycetota bacterium]
MHDTSSSVSAVQRASDRSSTPDNNPIPDADVETIVRLFKVLGDRTRLGILLILAKGERNVGALCEELSLPQPTVSHHLGLMRINRLIDNRRDGKQVFYTLAEEVSALKNGVVRIGVGSRSVDLNLAG